MNRKLWLLMTWLLVVPAFVQAASVRGVVVDYETNKPIANVKVAIRNVSAVTDFDGNFELEKVRAGSVVVVFTAADYKAYSVDFVVNDGVNTLNASLQPKKVGNTLNQQALEDNIFELDESAIDDEGSAASQSASYLSGAADWKLLNSTGEVVKEASNTTVFTVSEGIEEIGGYDLQVICDGETTTYGYYVQITSEAVGALPEIQSLTIGGEAVAEDEVKIDVDEALTGGRRRVELDGRQALLGYGYRVGFCGRCAVGYDDPGTNSVDDFVAFLRGLGSGVSPH